MLWRPLRCSEQHATLLLSALAKLHNLCVDGGDRAPDKGFRCHGNLRGDCDCHVEKYIEIAPDGSRHLATGYPDPSVAERYFDGAGNRVLGRHRADRADGVQQPTCEEMCSALAAAGMRRPTTSEYSYRIRLGIW